MDEKPKDSSKTLVSSISAEIPKKVDVILKRNIRWTIMIIYLLISIIISMDTGLFTSASTIIKETLQIDEVLIISEEFLEQYYLCLFLIFLIGRIC